MFANALLTLYRSLTRHKLYAALNILGLAVGIAVFLTLFLDVRFETSFERWIADAKQIYILRTAMIGPAGGMPPSEATMGDLWRELRAEYPQLVGARIWGLGGSVRQSSRAVAAQVEAVDPSFFDVFDLPLLAGDRASALTQPDSVILTSSKAQQLFGGKSPLGRSLTFSYLGSTHVHRVTGVIADPPLNTELSLDYIIPFQTTLSASEGSWAQWGSLQLRTYLRFPTAADAHALDANLDAFTDRHGVRDLGATPPPHESMKLRTMPVLELHLSNPKDAAVVTGIGAVGLLALLLAAVNYVNLATARAGLRAREVAMRKVLGATQPALVAQFIGEAVATAALGALIGLALCEAALPLVNAAGGLSLRIRYLGAGSVLPILTLVVVLVGFGAGLYPALALSRFRAAAVLASARTPGGGRTGARVREGLVLVQFAIAIGLTIVTAVIVSQTRYVRQADLGFQRHGLVVVSSFGDAAVSPIQRTSLLEAWRGIPGVAGDTAADIAPGVDNSTSFSNTKRLGDPGIGPSVSFVRAGPDFFETYSARLIAGRLPDRRHGGDYPPLADPYDNVITPIQNVVLNVGATHTLGFKTPQAAIGQTVLRDLSPGVFQPLSIIGVVSDIRFRSPRAPVPPTLYRSYEGKIPNVAAGVRFQGAYPNAMIDRLGAEWRRIVPDAPFRAKSAEDSLDRYYRPDDQHGRLFTIGAGLAVLIGCVGLYGLASFSTARRTKEIGIRKTLGASTADVLRLLVGQFLRPVVVANVIAWPLAYLLARNWLSGFDQHVALNPLYFLAATALAVAIAALTVVGQALRVARAEPAKALRHE